MAIAFGTTGSTSMTAAATSASVNISAATDGDWVYCWVALGVNAGAVSATGWTSLLDADEGTSAHYALLRRQKQAGDTSFTFSWTTSTKGTLAWASWSGLDGTTPDEGAALATNGSTSRTAVPSPSATPTAANRWAAAAFANRTTTVGNKPITWTADAAQTERVDVDNNAAGSAPWVGTEIADTASAVTQAAHSYTATHAPAAESHDGSAIWFLIPAAVTAATPQPLVYAQPWQPARTSAILASSFPLGNPAVPTPQPIVASAPYPPVRPYPPLISRNQATPVVSTVATPQPLVVVPPFTWPRPSPPAIVAAPSSTAAAPPPLIISAPWRATVQRPIIVTNAPTTITAQPTPKPLVAGPQFAWPAIPGARLYTNPQIPTAVPSVTQDLQLLVYGDPGLYWNTGLPDNPWTYDDPDLTWVHGNPAIPSTMEDLR